LHFAQPGDKRRSGITAEKQHHGFVPSEIRQIKSFSPSRDLTVKTGAISPALGALSSLSLWLILFALCEFC